MTAQTIAFLIGMSIGVITTVCIMSIYRIAKTETDLDPNSQEPFKYQDDDNQNHSIIQYVYHLEGRVRSMNKCLVASKARGMLRDLLMVVIGIVGTLVMIGLVIYMM